jgi:hypothetical protein
MFQYAIAFAFAKNNNTTPKLDIRDHQTHYDLHGYGLNHFSISGSVATTLDIVPFDYGNESIRAKIYRFFKKISGQHHYLVEKKLTNTDNLMTRKGDVFLDGFWQSEKFFIDHRAALINEFVPKEELNTASNEALVKIQNSNSVSIHVRRGDYASDPETRKIHGLCPMDYYKRAITHIKQKVQNPIFYLFSDDPEWAKEHLKLKDADLIDFNGIKKAHLDMWLMAGCKHNIIANSTFSWWGAWLNRNDDKIVIAPEKWFADPSRNSTDIIPNTWLRL